VVCRCGAKASQKVCEKAQAAAKKLAKEKGVNVGTASGKASDRGRSGPSAAGGSKELAELKAKLKEREKEIDRLKALPSEEEEEDDEDDKQAGPSIESLVNLHREAEKALGAEAQITKELEEKLRIARERRDADKPVATRLRDLEALSRKRKGQIDTAEEAVAEALEVYEEAKGKLDEAREDVAKRKRELSEVDAQIAELRAKQLLEAAAGEEQSPGEVELRALQRLLGKSPQVAAHLEGLRAAVKLQAAPPSPQAAPKTPTSAAPAPAGATPGTSKGGAGGGANMEVDYRAVEVEDDDFDDIEGLFDEFAKKCAGEDGNGPGDPDDAVAESGGAKASSPEYVAARDEAKRRAVALFKTVAAKRVRISPRV